MDIFEKCNQRYIQDEVRELGIYPYFHALESKQDTEVIMEGKRRIMLGSNNYLGLTTNPAVIQAGVDAYKALRLAVPQRNAEAPSGAGGGACKVFAEGRDRDVLDRLPVEPWHYQRDRRHA